MKPEACLVCGEELVYFEDSRELECVFCHGKFRSNAACRNGHYVCDRCHAAHAVEAVRTLCLRTTSRNPVEIAVEMMTNPAVHMHGPENHILVGAALLAAYHNAGGSIADRASALTELIQRGGQVPGGICGFWGCCGAAVSSGIFVSIVTGSTPLSTDAFGLSNQMTARSLAAIGDVGGPRCCKRNAFLTIGQAVVFCREKLGVSMEMPTSFACPFGGRNRECIGTRCPWHPRQKERKSSQYE